MVTGNKKHTNLASKPLLGAIRNLIESARKSAVRHIDSTMTFTYFLIGMYIVEDEQQGKKRAGYAYETLKFLGEELSREFGRGFSSRNLASMKKFYLIYQPLVNIEPISQTLSAKSSETFDNEQNNLILQIVSATVLAIKRRIEKINTTIIKGHV